MEKLRIQNDTYKIEVNDKGEYIEFNLRDINLPEKIVRATEKIGEEHEKYVKAFEEIREKYDGVELIKELGKIETEYFENTRKHFDSFLGEGACKKIFGEVNFYGMFEQLMEELEKHYPKMELNMEQIKKDLVAKYSINKEVM